MDYTIRFHGTTIPSCAVDFRAINDDVLTSLKYVRASKHALRSPELREDVGVFVSDSIVPPSLHQEVSTHSTHAAQPYGSNWYLACQGTVCPGAKRTARLPPRELWKGGYS